MEIRKILEQSNFGERIAEEESSELEKYFVETDQWRRILAGEVDVVYGAKGAGKSAVYSLLIRRAEELEAKGIAVVSGEKPRGTPIFKNLQQDPPTDEQEFVGLWKLYLLSLIGISLPNDCTNDDAEQLRLQLSQAGLEVSNLNLGQKLQIAFDYVKSFFRPQNLEGGVIVDPITGMPAGFTGKISFNEVPHGTSGIISVNDLLAIADRALRKCGRTTWLLLDRLDVAFTESPDLEENALRALFRVYLDILDLKHICPKIFLRSDIWSRITKKGFREASHITRDVTIDWDSTTLLNLIVRRILKNDAIVQHFKFAVSDVMSDIKEQSEAFYRLFPNQVDVGDKKPTTLDWLLSRCADGTTKPAPREIIHLLNVARQKRIREFEVGSADTEILFSRSSLKFALPEVSATRLQQTLLAEYPQLRISVLALKGEKTLQYPFTLARIWGVEEFEANRIARHLVDVGFFEFRGTNSEPAYWVPFLYRDAAGVIQGTADS